MSSIIKIKLERRLAEAKIALPQDRTRALEIAMRLLKNDFYKPHEVEPVINELVPLPRPVDVVAEPEPVAAPVPEPEPEVDEEQVVYEIALKHVGDADKALLLTEFFFRGLGKVRPVA
jgi:hypothetical protein